MKSTPRVSLILATSLSASVALLQLAACANSTLGEQDDAAPDSAFRPRSGDDGSATNSGADASTDAAVHASVDCTTSPCVVDVALAETHTCALLADGTVRCWGANAAGELGSSLPAMSLTPVSVSGVTGALAVLAGGGGQRVREDDVSCAEVSSGFVCWGSNQNSMLGRGPSLLGDPDAHPDPQPIIALAPGAHLALGGTHACAVSKGSVSCWGLNDHDQLGQGDTDAGPRSSTPLSVVLPAARNAVELALADSSTCALLDDGTVACWGADGNSECGGPSTTDYPIPTIPTATIVSGISGVAHLAAGQFDMCAITNDGKVWCWGTGEFGVLGSNWNGAPLSGQSSATPIPIDLPAGRKAIQIAAGLSAACALLDDATVACWGDNGGGGLAIPFDASAPYLHTTATVIVGLTNVAQIALGAESEHACARIIGGGLKCWGSNQYDQLGAPSDASWGEPFSSTPLDVIF